MIRTPPRTVAGPAGVWSRLPLACLGWSLAAAPVFLSGAQAQTPSTAAVAGTSMAEARIVESRLGLGDSRTTEIGQRLEYRRETLNYVQAEGRHL